MSTDIIYQKIQSIISNDNGWLEDLINIIIKKVKGIFSENRFGVEDLDSKIFYATLFCVLLRISSQPTKYLIYQLDSHLKTKRYLKNEEILPYIDDILFVSNFLIPFINNQNIVWLSKYKDLIDEKRELEERVKISSIKNILNDVVDNEHLKEIFKLTANNNIQNKMTRGRKPRFNNKLEFISAVTAFADYKNLSETKKAKALNMSESNFRKLKKKFGIQTFKIDF